MDTTPSDRVRACMTGRGDVFSPAHALQVDTSVDHILAIYHAAEEYGRYQRNVA